MKIAIQAMYLSNPN